LLEQLQRLLFDTRKAAKALGRARANGAYRDEGGWLKLTWALQMPGWMKQKGTIPFERALEMVKEVDCLEHRIDGVGCAWVRRRDRANLPDRLDINPEAPPDLEEPKRPITLRMLLTHTAGIGYDFSLYRPPPTAAHAGYTELVQEVEQRAVPDLEAWCDRMAQVPLLFQPGEDFRYGYSFDIIGRVAEVVSGMPLDKFIETIVLRPLAMNDTSFSVPPSKLHRLVPLRRHHFCVFKDGGKEVPLDPGSAESRWAAGRESTVLSAGGAVEVMAGGMVSSLRDYISFIEMLLRRGAAPDGTQIIRPETVQMATDGRQLALATSGLMKASAPGRSMGFLGEVIGPFNAGAGLISWGGTAGTHFGLHIDRGYAVVFCAQTFGAPKCKQFLEDAICPAFED